MSCGCRRSTRPPRVWVLSAPCISDTQTPSAAPFAVYVPNAPTLEHGQCLQVFKVFRPQYLTGLKCLSSGVDVQ
ncbi:hypothetical protein BaRGS_00013666, partial [Batillaria attramentaria]